jgi:hypothetical protein
VITELNQRIRHPRVVEGRDPPLAVVLDEDVCEGVAAVLVGGGAGRRLHPAVLDGDDDVGSQEAVARLLVEQPRPAVGAGEDPPVTFGDPPAADQLAAEVGDVHGVVGERAGVRLEVTGVPGGDQLAERGVQQGHLGRVELR